MMDNNTDKFVDIKPTFILSKEVVDRDFELIKVAGIDLNNFMKNPIMFYQHDQYCPIGYWDNPRIEGDALVADAVITDQTTKELVANGTIRAVSIGFKPKEFEDIKPIPEEYADEVETWGRNYLRTYNKVELYEASLVTIPANPEAVRKSFDENNKEAKSIIRKYIEINTTENSSKTISGAETSTVPEAVGEIQKASGDVLKDEITLKAGAVLNSANKERLLECYNNIRQVLQDAGVPLESEEMPAEPPAMMEDKSEEPASSSDNNSEKNFNTSAEDPTPERITLAEYRKQHGI